MEKLNPGYFHVTLREIIRDTIAKQRRSMPERAINNNISLFHGIIKRLTRSRRSATVALVLLLKPVRTHCWRENFFD